MNLAIAVPSTDICTTDFALSLANCVGYTVANNVVDKIQMLGLKGTVLPAQRVQLARDARKLLCDAIVWFDSDMVFPPETIERLMSHAHPLIGANYPRRKPPYSPTARLMDGSLCYTDEFSPETEAVSAMGMGCMWTSLEVFDKIPEPAFTFDWIPDAFDFGGEDTSFCQRALLAGFQPTVDHVLSRAVKHEGMSHFTHGHALMHRARQLVRA